MARCSISDRCRHAVVVLALSAVACGGDRAASSGDGSVTPVYNERTGRLEQIVSDRNGDGTVDTWAFMDGTRIVRVEIDKDGDGVPDRWEYYETSPADSQASVIERAEEARGSDKRIVRREFYAAGALQRVEEDTDVDGRMDKWEVYREGRLAHVDLDLNGSGRPTRRLIYGASGGVERAEADADGDGVFEPVAAPSSREGSR